MNWHNIGLLLRFDLFYSLTRLRGWIFLAPFSLYWFLVFYHISTNKDALGKVTSQEAVAAMEYYGAETAMNLFVNHPISVSLPFCLLLITTPFFVVLASFGQFCTDLRSGFFRFIITRCSRLDIFLARLLSALLLVICAFLTVTCISTVLSLLNDGFPALAVLQYAAQTWLTLMLYALPFIAMMSLLSALFNSQIAVLFIGFSACTLIYIFFIYATATQGSSLVAFLLPIALLNDLVALDKSDYLSALAILPVYFLAYAILAFTVFDRRNF